MRPFVLLLLVVVLVLGGAANAVPLPLTTKDVSLMLRTGYSSESVLQEIATRRMTAAPNESERRTLAEAGASATLLQALETGEFQVDEATAENARQAAREASARQAAEATKVFRAGTAALQDQRAKSAAAKSADALTVIDLLRGKLVVCQNGVVTPLDPNAEDDKQLFAIYYSAHWCPPCRKFTPELVEYYNRIKPQHPKFELIFVSSDRSRFNWENYLRELKMPWPAVDFDQLEGFAALKKAGGKGIPSLLLVDRTGKVLARSYDGDNYLGPQHVVAELDKIFAAAR